MKTDSINSLSNSSIDSLIILFKERLPECTATYAWANETGLEYIRLCELRASGNSDNPVPGSLLSEFLKIAPEPNLPNQNKTAPTYESLFGQSKTYIWCMDIKDLTKLELQHGGMPNGST